MNKISITTLCIAFTLSFGNSQSKVMTPEQLIELNRVSAVGLTADGQQGPIRMYHQMENGNS